MLRSQPDAGEARAPWGAGPTSRGEAALRPRRPWRRARRPLLGLLLAALPLLLACGQSSEDRLEEARSLQELGAWDEATDELRALLEEEPEHPEANLRLGYAQLQQGRPSLAIWPLQLAARDPEHAQDAQLQLALAYLQLTQFDATIDAATRVVEADAPEAQLGEALELRARAHLEMDRHEQALADAEHLTALRPNDPTALSLRANAQIAAGQAEGAEETLRRMWEAGPEELPPMASLQAGLGLARLYEQELDDEARAARQLETVLERYPESPDAVRTAIEFYDAREDEPRAEEVLRRAVEAAPESLDLRAVAAEWMSAHERTEEGEAILVEGTQLLGSPEAFLALERYRSLQGDRAGALEALERAIELVAEPSDMLRFKRGDLLAGVGELDEAEAIGDALGDTVYGHVLRGRVAFEQGAYQEALEELDAGLRRWPNNPGARHIAGKAAIALGDLERAVSDLREAVRATEGDSDAGLDLAELHLRHGELDRAHFFARQAYQKTEELGGDPARIRRALTLLVRVAAAQGDLEEAQRFASGLASMEEGTVPAFLTLSEAVREARGAATAADLLANAELDLEAPENLPVLRRLVDYELEAGRAESASRRVASALEAHAEEPALHDIQARLLARTGRVEEARRAFEAALERDAAYAPALEGLAYVARVEGDAERAAELLERAAEADPERPAAPYAAAQLALAAGETRRAEEHLREALRREPGHPEASNDLAWLLAERGERLDEALTLAQRATTLRPEANFFDTLGWVQLRRGEAEAAVATLQRAREANGSSPSIAYRLALALAETGRSEEARALLEEALAAEGPFPEAEAAREQLTQLGS